MFVLLALLMASAPSSLPVEPPNWSFGGGAGILLYPTNTYLGIGALPSPSVDARLSFERRLVGSLWLVAQLNGGYLRAEGGPYQGLAGVTEQGELGGALGVRYAVNVAQLFDVSPFLLLGGSWLRSVQGPTTSNGIDFYGHDVSGWGMHARVGLAIERELVRGLSLRLFSSIAELRYSDVRGVGAVVAGGIAPPVRQQVMRLGLAFTPGIELRMRF